VHRRDEPRSSLSVGLEWASRVTTLGLSFVVPAILGALLDHWLGISPVALLLGAVLGFAVGMVQILRLAAQGTSK
jgi:F0F1-type ATP synthase assembly protein I